MGAQGAFFVQISLANVEELACLPVVAHALLLKADANVEKLEQVHLFCPIEEGMLPQVKEV